MKNPLGRSIPLPGDRVLLASGEVFTTREVRAEHNRRQRARNAARTEGQVIAARASMHPGGTKRCSRCGRELAFHAFASKRSTRDGLNERCFGCRPTQETEHD